MNNNYSDYARGIERHLGYLRSQMDNQGIDWERSEQIRGDISHWEAILNRVNDKSLSQEDLNELNELIGVRLLRTDQRIKIDSFSFETESCITGLLKDISFNKKDIQKLIGSQEEDLNKLFQELIKNFLPHNSLQICYIVNRSFKKAFYRYLVRPTEVHPLIKGKDLSISFEFSVDWHTFRLSLKRINPIYNQTRRGFELEAELHLYLNDNSQKITKVDRTTLETYACPQGLEISKRLGEWTDYLNWKRKRIEKDQFWSVYRSIDINNDKKIITILAPVSNANFERTKRKLYSFVEDQILIADFSQSKSKESWNPVSKFPDFIQIGTLISWKILEAKKRTAKDDEDDDSILIEFVVDYSQEDETSFEDIPEKGFVLNSVIGDLHSINIQEKGIERLQNFEAVNNNLTDFIFDSSGAQKADSKNFTPFTFLREDLNEDQQSAIRKAILAPDLFLMQGPPGTGKTTTITEICNYYCLQQKRVLLASQSNLAVDNALVSLIDRNYIYPMRIGSRPTEFGTKFLKNEVLKSWIEKIHKSCKSNYDIHSKIVNNIENLTKSSKNMKDYLSLILSNTEKYNDKSSKIQSLEKTQQENRKTWDQLDKDKQNKQKQRDALTKFLNFITNDKLESQIEFFEILFELYDLKTIEPYEENHLILNEFDFFSKNDYKCRKQFNIILVEQQKNAKTALKRVNDYYENQKEFDVSELLEQNSEFIELISIKKKLIDSVNEQDIKELIQINKKIKKIQDAIKFKDWIEQQDLLAQIIKSLKIKESKMPKEWKSVLNSLYPDDNLISLLNTLVKIIDSAFTDYKTIFDSYQIQKKHFAIIHANLTKKLEELDEEMKKLAETIKKEEESIKELEKEIISIHAYDLELKESWNQEIKSLEKYLNNEINLVLEEYTQETIEKLNNFIEKAKKDNESQIKFNSLWGNVQAKLLEKYQDIISNESKGLKEIEGIYESNVNVLGLTCAEAGKKGFYANDFFKPFDVVIIDEVSRATPPELLLPLLLGKKVILMGDHRQLPPIFKEKKNEEFEETDSIEDKLLSKYEKMFSAMLFNELYLGADESIREPLITQYRFHPQIMEIVNFFYQDTPLKCGIKDPDRTRAHNLAIPRLLNPDNHVLWIDSSIDHNGKKTKEEYDRTSAYNTYEIDLIAYCLIKLNEALQNQNKRKKIGIITFYGAQIKRIRKKIEEIKNLNKTSLDCLELRYNTVDKFQGMEREIIIVSFVRTSPRVREFVRNFHRINVAISRAKELLIIIGNAEAYQKYDVEVFNSSGKKEVQRIYDKMIYKIKGFNGFLNPRLIGYKPIALNSNNQSNLQINNQLKNGE